MTPRQAVAFIRKYGVVLESAAGPVPSLAAAIAGVSIQGSWWSHARGHEIFEVTRAVREHEEILVCRLVNGKITYVHHRLWPAVLCAAKLFPKNRLAQLREVHTPSGRHVTHELPFPQWVPADIFAAASHLAEEKALRDLGAWCTDLRSPSAEKIRKLRRHHRHALR